MSIYRAVRNTAKDTRHYRERHADRRISKVRRVHLDRNKPKPLYLQLAAILRRANPASLAYWAEQADINGLLDGS